MSSMNGPKSCFLFTFQYNLVYLSHGMMEKIKHNVDEIVTTRATGIQYSYVHLKKQARAEDLSRALTQLASDGVRCMDTVW